MGHSGVGAAVLGGWSLNGVFSHLSGLPFTVTAANSSCNCPNAISTQLANQVKSDVAKGSVPHTLNDSNTWFDPTAFAPVTTASFGNSSCNSLRGPGYTNLDASVFRDFQIWERLSMQFRAESFNCPTTRTSPILPRTFRPLPSRTEPSPHWMASDRSRASLRSVACSTQDTSALVCASRSNLRARYGARTQISRRT